MTDAPESEPTPPNEARKPEPIEEVDGESIAIPAGDITGAITEALEELTDRDE